MKIEILFPEFCNLFGDVGNVKYLKMCLPNAEFIETSFNSEPFFKDNDVNIVYMGPMTERAQEKIIKKLLPLKQRIEQLINNGTSFLFTGNALEIVGNYIDDDNGNRIDCLGIFDFYSKRNMMKRYSGLTLGEYNDIEIVGFKAQFTKAYQNSDSNHFIKVTRGLAMNDKSCYEGFVKNNFFGTYMIGPLLVLNPLFTKIFLKNSGVNNPTLAFEKEALNAYYKRLDDFKNPKVHIH